MVPNGETRPDRVDAGPLQLGVALQGGGSHGAFGWGVLHELLECPDVSIAALSGTSAGAVNAAVLADGWVGRPEAPAEGAQAALARFWTLNATTAQLMTGGLLRPGLGETLRGDPSLKTNPLYIAGDLLGRLFSQYECNIDVNPLRELLQRWYRLDIARLRDPAAPILFLCATNVATGEALVFDNDSLSLNAILASACLPTLTRAVEVKGQPCWDGGYSANPAIWPLMHHTSVDDVLVVQINPVDVDEPPQTARDIVNRINEITFNSSLIAQMRSIERVNDLYVVIDAICDGLNEIDPATREAVLTRLTARMRAYDDARRATRRLSGRAHHWRVPRALMDALGKVPEPERLDTRQFEEHPLRPVALHIVHGDDALDPFDASSKYNATPESLGRLFQAGRSKARDWITRTLPAIRANQAARCPVSTFAPEAGLSGR